jgi:peptidase M15-like protein
MGLRDFADSVFDYALAFSGSVTSWVRSVDHNRKVAGVASSAHLRGLAVDMVYDGARPGPEADQWLARRGLRRIEESDHDHIMPRDWPPA